MMLYRFGKKYALRLLIHQLKNNFFIQQRELILLLKYYNRVLEKIEKCFSASTNKYYHSVTKNGKETYFDPLHSCQWFIFLYFFANTIYKNEQNNKTARKLCDEIYLINIKNSGANIYYEIDMPSIFMCDHPIGTVLGRAKYGDGFSFSQGNTVGNNHGIYPELGKNVTMFSNSKILGKCKIGNNVIISANAYIKDQDIPDNSIVFGQSPNLVIKNNK